MDKKLFKKQIEDRIKQQERSKSNKVILANLALEKFPNKIIKSKILVKIRELDLSNNSLSVLPNSISKLVELQILQLSSNRFREFPKEICTLTQLTTLSLNSNQIPEIPKSIGQLKLLQCFSMSNNLLESLPDEMIELSQLNKLDLVGNQIPLYYQRILACNLKGNMNELNLTSTQMVVIPKTIVHFKENLQCLVLSNNQITDISSELLQLSNLLQLELRNNNLKQIPTEISKLQKLKVLGLSNNNIQIIPFELKQLKELNLINLSNNFIKQIPETIFQIENLKELYLAGNLISVIPNSLKKLNHLNVLSLQNNEIFHFPVPLFKNIPSLHSINLSNNPIHLNEINLEQLFTQLNSISEINFSNTKIPKEIQQFITFKNSLKDFHLEFNSSNIDQLSYLLHTFYFIHLHNLIILDIDLFNSAPISFLSGPPTPSLSTNHPIHHHNISSLHTTGSNTLHNMNLDLPLKLSNSDYTTDTLTNSGNQLNSLLSPRYNTSSNTNSPRTTTTLHSPGKGGSPLRGSRNTTESKKFDTNSINNSDCSDSKLSNNNNNGSRSSSNSSSNNSLVAMICKYPSSKKLNYLKISNVKGLERKDFQLINDHLNLLEKLDLSNNLIYELPLNFLNNQTKLLDLNISNNKLGNISLSYSMLMNIQFLDISSNEFTELPIELFQLSQLKGLHCNFNKIKSIPTFISNLTNLIDFSIEKNEIQSIPNEFCALIGNIKILSLSNNQLSSPIPFQLILSIPSITIDNNYFPNEIQLLYSNYFGKKQRLDLSNQSISHFPSDESILLSHYQHLTYLNLSCNQLASLPPSLSSLQSLSILSAHHNRISTFPSFLSSLSSLLELDLSDNNISDVSDDDFNNLHSIFHFRPTVRIVIKNNTFDPNYVNSSILPVTTITTTGNIPFPSFTNP